MHKNIMTWQSVYVPETGQKKATNGRERSNKMGESYEDLSISLGFKTAACLWPSSITRQGLRWKEWVTNQPQNLRSTVCPACRVFGGQSLAESSSRRPERVHAATDGSRSRIPPPKIRQSLGRPAEEGEEELYEPERSEISWKHHPQNLLTRIHGICQS